MSDDDENERVTAKPPMPQGHEPPSESFADPPLRSGMRRLITSSKGILCVAALVGVCVMNYLGRIDGERALEFITWVIGFYVAGTALEDGIEKFRPRDLGSANLSAVSNLALGIAEGIKSYYAQQNPNQPITRDIRDVASTCSYTVQDNEDDLDAIVAAALRAPDGTPAPAELIQKCVGMINMLNSGTPDQYWKAKSQVILPRVVCLYLLKIHPEMTQQ